MKLGILKESKTPPERRTPFTPVQCKRIFESYPQVKVVVQPSPVRCFMDEEYEDVGIPLQTDLSDCDILIGVKEVEEQELIPNKTYLIFSHTIKKQNYNKKLLRAILEKNIRLIDYELLTNENKQRLIGFGRWAGLVGAYNGIRTFAIRNNIPEPKPAHLCENLEELMSEAKQINLPALKIVITGGGRVSHGATEILDNMGVKRISPEKFLEQDTYSEPVYTQLEPSDYYKHSKGEEFDFTHFVENPQEYDSDFKKYSKHTDLLISAAYWDPRSPVLFTVKEMQESDFKLKVIADITCDIEGSIPSTLRPSLIQDPFYGFNPFTGKEELAFVGDQNISVMAVDNLPCELPNDASEEFGKDLIEKIIPLLICKDVDQVLERATIAENGALTDRFLYLKEWVENED